MDFKKQVASGSDSFLFLTYSIPCKQNKKTSHPHKFKFQIKIERDFIYCRFAENLENFDESSSAILLLFFKISVRSITNTNFAPDTNVW